MSTSRLVMPAVYPWRRRRYTPFARQPSRPPDIGSERPGHTTTPSGTSSVPSVFLSGWLLATVRGELVGFVQVGSSRQVRGTIMTTQQPTLVPAVLAPDFDSFAVRGRPAGEGGPRSGSEDSQHAAYQVRMGGVRASSEW